MTVARCLINGCSWEQYREDPAEAAKLRERHEMLRHPEIYGVATNQAPPERVVQLADVDWWTQAIDAIASQPAGKRFTIYEVCAHLDEPPTSNGWQNLARDAHHLGLIVKVGGVESKRPGTRQSMTGLWERTEKAHAVREPHDRHLAAPDQQPHALVRHDVGGTRARTRNRRHCRSPSGARSATGHERRHGSRLLHPATADAHRRADALRVVPAGARRGLARRGEPAALIGRRRQRPAGVPMTGRGRIRRHFCWPCDRWTFRAHRHADATFNALVRREVHG